MLKFNENNLASLNFMYGIFQRWKLTFPNSAVEIKGKPFRNFQMLNQDTFYTSLHMGTNPNIEKWPSILCWNEK